MAFDYSKLLFPYNEVRAYQDLLIQNINASIESHKALIAHAPTGLGKTAASLSTAIKHAIDHDLTVFFLTPRHTQHRLVVDTVKAISAKYNLKIPVVDLVSKQLMCPMPIAKDLNRSDFIEYCKEIREKGKCPYYSNTRKVELSEKATSALNEFLDKPAMHTEEMCDECVSKKLCPYEMALELGKQSKVVVCDYFHLFSDDVRKTFLSKMNKDLEDAIIIVDEAHNLPDRIRGLMTYRLTTNSINGAIRELTQHSYDDEEDIMRTLLRVMESLIDGHEREGLIKKESLINELTRLTGMPIDEIITDLVTAGNAIREEAKKSYTLAIARFLESWNDEASDRLRVIRREGLRGAEFISLTYHCLNPAAHTQPIFDEAHSTIVMSGTLSPLTMYSEVLGLKDAGMLELKSPFPQENRLTLIYPETTTKFSRRGDDEYEKMADKINKMLNNLTVSSAVFFPSYAILNSVYQRFIQKTGKTVFSEQAGLSKEGKQALLDVFRRTQGSVLFAVVSGSFGEGVDLPGNELECIIIVGIPLPVPDLYTKALIDYYQNKFGKGWDYGYVYPALTKVIQSAGRCIRQSSDRGLIVLMDERYAWQNYLKCIPTDWVYKVTKEPETHVKEFFKHQE